MESPLKGIICMWSGAIVDIPNGWALCDGTQGTPDLLYRFIWGAGPALPPGNTGGTSAHNHAVSDPGHSHWISEDGDIIDSYPAGDLNRFTDETVASITVLTKSHLPPYFSLAYIMKL